MKKFIILALLISVSPAQAFDRWYGNAYWADQSAQMRETMREQRREMRDMGYGHHSDYDIHEYMHSEEYLNNGY
jgi:hypothetical protein